MRARRSACASGVRYTQKGRPWCEQNGSEGEEMRVTETNWMQLDQYVRHDDRAIMPLGSVEQHGYLSLGTDMILAERVAVEAAEPLGIPVFPALPYGITPYFRAFPGSLGLRVSTYMAVVRDLLECMLDQGFRRVVLVNGHGGNSPVAGLAAEFTADHPEARIVVHNWWNAPQTWQAVMAEDADASHASWMEGFPWTRVAPAPA